MKRKVLIGIGCLLAAAWLGMVLFTGNIWQVETELTASDMHSDQDLQQCASLVKEYFFWNFQGSKLNSLYYDAEFNEEVASYEAERMGRREALILHSDWVHRGIRGPVEPGYVYAEWKWIFTKSPQGDWELVNYGYG